ncbi:hypothetical protein [Microbacterium sp. AG238]|uniref:hypothetical protein n=1 Tax=Microbacterium sp. AG238 TaxID=2183994 RepID=UPI000E765E38|nr:hypothetical protein [Microbacterium sp. AG238]RKE60445.1 hypothetical protein DEU36_2887 [Microbacterium sp. AG238]
MNRSERALAAIVDTELRLRQEAIQAADDRTLRRLREAGLYFRAIGEVAAYQRRQRDAARATAALIDMRHEIADPGRTA